MNNAPLPFSSEQLPQFMRVALDWFSLQPIVSGLLILMLIDVLTGCCLAVVQKKLSSTTSWRGMCKKVIVLLLVGVAAVLEPFANGIPLSKLVAVFYIVTEALSIMENAAMAGVPLPAPLIDALVKLKEQQREARPNMPQNSATTTVRLEGELRVPGVVSSSDQRRDS